MASLGLQSAALRSPPSCDPSRDPALFFLSQEKAENRDTWTASNGNGEVLARLVEVMLKGSFSLWWFD